MATASNTIRSRALADGIEFRVATRGIIDWDAIGRAVVEKHVWWNENTGGTAEVSAALLAHNFRHWGSGRVVGTFVTEWNRSYSDFVVRTYSTPQRWNPIEWE